MKVQIGKYRKNRKQKVEIEPFDTWNLDHTLSLIIWPSLVQLKETGHGIFWVDQKDLPENLQYIFPEDPSDYNERQEKQRITQYEWVMDEMIWAMSQIANDIPDEPRFTDNKTAFKKYHERIQNGCELFGKYFRNLWD